MRRKPLLKSPAILLTFLPSVLAIAQSFLPVETAIPGAIPDPAAVHQVLRPRQTNACISGTYSCESQGSAFDGICCADGQVCALDASNNPACCPSGAVCTGTAPSTYVAPTTTAVSYVANPYFSFPYIATSFSNSAVCTRALSQCSENFAACTRDLEGLGAGAAVTIVVPGGGGSTTIAGAVGTTLATSSATSICASLSTAACHGLQSTYCAQVGTTAGFVVGNSANAARPTAMPCVGIVAGVAAGVGFGMMGV